MHEETKTKNRAILIAYLLMPPFRLRPPDDDHDESPRGPDYMRDRYQRMELFIVPVLQWLACLVIGGVLSVDACRRGWQRRAANKEQ